MSKALEIVERAAFTDEEMLFYDKFWDRVSVQRTLDDAIKKRQAELDSKEAELGNKEAELGNKEAELGNKEAELDSKEAELGNKEAELNNKEKQIELAEKKVRDSIQRLKALGVMSTQQIADTMGLSVEEVEAL